jgi:hypothetical protein
MIIWNALLAWLGINTIDISTWGNFNMVKDLWLSFIYTNGTKRKSFTSLIMLAFWLKRNARVFQKFLPYQILL